MSAHLNPVLARELKIRVRGWRSVIMLTVYLLLLLLTVWVAYEGLRPSQFESFDATSAAQTGRSLFGWILSLMVVLLSFLVPGMVAGSIAGERERQTLVPLQVTLMRPHAIVSGKIAAAVSWVVLMVVATAPLLAVCFLIGGVSLGDVGKAIVGLLALTVLLACIGVLCSAVFRRVQWATVVSYALVALLMVGTFVAFGAIAAVQVARSLPGEEINPPEMVLTPNPLVAFGDFIGDEDRGETPFDGLKAVANNGREAQGGQFELLGLPFWAVSTLLLGTLSMWAFLAASRRVRAPSEVER